jgi:hypothetical protein
VVRASDVSSGRTGCAVADRRFPAFERAWISTRADGGRANDTDRRIAQTIPADGPRATGSQRLSDGRRLFL